MIILSQELIRIIANNLKFKEILKYSITNKFLYSTIDNNFYRKLAIKYFSKDFWNKAYKRPVYYSKPLKNVKMELIRIENFQMTLEKFQKKRWTQKDFYDYWKKNDKILFNV